MSELVEYKILSGASHECEDKLNQWKEMYDLTILEMCSYGDRVSILLLRTIPQPDKEKEQ